MRDRILVIQLARLGDLVQTVPFLKDLRHNYQDSRIALLCQKKLVPLARMIEGLDEVIPFPLDDFLSSPDDRGGTIPHLWDFLRPLFQQKYPMVLNLNYSLISALAAEGLCEPQGEIIGNFLGADGRVLKRSSWFNFIGSFSSRRRLNPFNLVDVFRYLIPGERNDLYPMLRLDNENSWHRRSDKPLVVFLLGAGAKKRQWPVFNFVKLAKLLQKKTGVIIALVGSKKDRALSRIFARRSTADFVDLVGKLDLVELCRVLKEACLVIGSDTGPLHLAAALNTRTLGLYFGPAWVHETGPYGEGHTVFQVDVPCGPCLDRGICKEYLCRKVITPDLVAPKAIELITGEKTENPPIPDSLHLYVSQSDGKTTRYIKKRGNKAESDTQVVRNIYRYLASRFFHFPDQEKQASLGNTGGLVKDITYALYCLNHDYLGFSVGPFFEPWIRFVYSYKDTREEIRGMLTAGFDSVFEYLKDSANPF